LIGEQRPAEAVSCLEDALRFDPGNAQNHFLLGVALGQSGRYAEGMRELEQAVALDPGLERAKAMLAQARALGIR
jgi:cytochrome c-type biogenesis protein CcmH/NrfG